MANPPPLNSTVLYQNAFYQVRNGTRNKTTKAITLYLCHCSDTTCQHTVGHLEFDSRCCDGSAKTPAPLEQVTQLPQKGDRICHFKTRKPYTAKGYKLGRENILIECECNAKNIAFLQLNHIDLLPSVGDRVLVAAKPYCDWVRAKAKALRGYDPHPPWQHRQLIDSLDDLGWMSTVFDVRAIKQLAICVGDGMRKELPVECLRVLEKKQQREIERAAA